MSPKIKSLTCLMVFFTAIIPAAESVSAEYALDIYIREAVENNPRVEQAYHAWQAANHKIKSVSALPDPMATYGYFQEEIQTRVGPQEQKFGASQKFPFPGKRRLKGKAQKKQARMLQEAYEAAKQDVIKDVKMTYYDLYWVDKAIEVNAEEKSILEKVERVAQRKYESNLVPQQDVIKAQVALSNIIQKLYSLQQNRKSLAANMNRLLDRLPEAEIGKVTDIKETDLTLELDDMMRLAEDNRPELIAAKLAIEKAEFERSLAKMNVLPDFTIGAEYIDIGAGTTTMPNDGDDAWMGTVSINVPIWGGRLNAEIKEKQEELTAARKNRESVESQVAFELQDLYFKITAYRDIVLLYKTALIPQARQAFDASQTGFETGQVSFLDWLDTERTFLQTRLAYYKAVSDLHKSIAMLERMAGTSFQGGQHEG